MDCRVTFRLSPNSPKRKAARSGTAPYSHGASERLQTVPYRLYKLAEEVDIVWTVPRCMDCSPNSPKRKAARSGTAPYSLGAAERLETVPYRLYKLADEVDIVGTVPRTVRKEKRRVRGPRPTATLLLSPAGGGAGGGCSSARRNGCKPFPTSLSATSHQPRAMSFSPFFPLPSSLIAVFP